ncbi:MAG: XTP/dITP diphosphatase [Methylocystaceae bacterium]
MLMNQVLLATRNEKKRLELANILGDKGIEVLSLQNYPEIPDVEETGETFAENALLKARTVCQHTGLITLADDSGLEVDFIGGQPGVYSARFAGKAHDDQLNNQKLLALLSGVPSVARTARFRCVIAIVTPEGKEYLTSGQVEGFIGEGSVGEKGFGYDPLFIPAGFDHTFGELSSEVKNRISHRGRALTLAASILKEVAGDRA